MLNFIDGFFSGLGYFRKGLQLFAKHSELRKFILLPLLINLIVLLLLVLFMNWKFGAIFDFVSSYLPPFEMDGDGILISFLNLFLTGLFYLLKILVWLIVLIMTILVFYLIGAIVNAPFNDLISERVEALYGRIKPEEQTIGRFLANLPRVILTELKKSLFFITLPVLLLVLNLVPGIGSLIYVIIVNVVTAWTQGFLFVDYPMARRQMSFAESLSFSFRHFWSIFGFGLPTLVPFFIFFTSPFLVAGGTLLYLELNRLPGESR